MRRGWLLNAGPHKVEHLTWDYVKKLPQIDQAHPPLGLLHTTQGPTIEGAIAVFREHYAPHFTVGVDSKRRGRIVQHVPLGTLAAALENRAGGVETNREVRVQIEIVGYAQEQLWLPEEPVLGLLAALLAQLEVIAGIPLEHPKVARSTARWVGARGWVGHIDAPENAHWDPGAINYPALFKLAGALDEVGRINVGKCSVVPKPRKLLPLTRTAGLAKDAKVAAPHPLCSVTTDSAPAKKAYVLLKRGDTGAEVSRLQRRLAAHGAKVTVDGQFGPRTEASLRAFQRRSRLPVNGKTTPKTWQALEVKP